jgi:hypothetical protein
MELLHLFRWLLAFDWTFVVVLYGMAHLHFAALEVAACVQCCHRLVVQEISASGQTKMMEQHHLHKEAR